ncbi:MAG: serine hydrolase [Flavobacteriaceae bacterium]|nr:beta-lactamase family protein [Bacteroidia bacterium]MBT8286874.1 beta-lactamase family protein [Bacteroidia bacterium]NNF75765.1 serine hydrolase [Flavobacteriaceae bacterium]
MTALFRFLSLFLIFSIVGCDSGNSGGTSDDDPNVPVDENNYFPVVGSDEWETTDPAQLGWDESSITELYDFLETNNTVSFIVLKEGKIALEAYFNGGSQDIDWPWYSAGKTIVALTMGIAQEEGYLNLDDPSRNYLGNGWSSLTDEQENEVTIWHHLTMTTGLDYTNVFTQFCTLPACLNYLNEAGSFWYYHNAPYTLNQSIITGATGSFFENYFNAKIKDPIGMNGFWQPDNFNVIYNSSARSMARFGLLVLNNGQWDGESILSDSGYLNNMQSSSQNLNEAYGYLWWLNGKNSYRLPGTTNFFTGKLIPNAPDDLFAGLGFSDQKLYIIPSLDMVVVRLGNAADTSEAGPSGFDNTLWEKLNAVFN